MSTPFRRLEPPPGGLVKLRAKLAAHRRRVLQRRIALAMLAMLICILGGTWLMRMPRPSPRVVSPHSPIDWAALHPAVSLAERSAHTEASVHVARTSGVGVMRVVHEQGVSYYRISALPVGQSDP